MIMDWEGVEGDLKGGVLCLMEGGEIEEAALWFGKRSKWMNESKRYWAKRSVSKKESGFPKSSCNIHTIKII